MLLSGSNVEATTSFLVEWVRAPLTTASALPSSRKLARRMVAGLEPDRAPVIELGPGTGAFTRALLARGFDPSDLILVELNAKFARRLARQYPRAHLVEGVAEQLGALALPGPRRPGAVVSGLPFLNMRDHQIEAILEGAFRQMRPDGVFIQFTYRPLCPVKRAILRRLGLVARRRDFVAGNIPPASVYRISRG